MNPLRAARAIAALTAASRVLGMVREIVFASVFGAGAVADAFRIAFQLPNTFRRIFGEGALASAMIPVLSRIREREGAEGVLRAAGPLLGTLRGLLVGLSVAGVAAILLGTPWAASLAVDPDKAKLTGWLMALLFPYMAFICLAAAQGGVLNAVDSFDVPAASPVLFNVVSLAGLAAAAWIAPRAGAVPAVFCAAGAVLAAGAAQSLSQTWGLARVARAAGAARPAPRWDAHAPVVRRIRRDMLPIVAGLAPAQVGVLLDTWIAEIAVPRDGAVAHLGFGHVLVHLPLAIAGVSVATASFPLFSRLWARGDRAGLAVAVAAALRQALFLLAPAAVGLLFFAVPVVRLVYERGAFGAEATTQTARVTAAYAAGLVAYGFHQVLVRALYATGDRRSPARIALGAVLLNVLLNLWWVRPWGEAGIAGATAAAAWAGVAATLAVLAARLKGAVWDRAGFARSVLRTGGACTVLGAWLWAMRPFCTGEGAAARAAAAGAVLCGVLIFLAVAWIARSEELRAVLSRGATPPSEADR